ncbi:sensor histidine kinase [Sphingobacterium sp. xlx-130]|uniref:sensor histidine kinase n=1 Tax=Sphingobacterium sp. xlx-130 TaxID=2654323 RepID=UPI0013DD68DF|nr:HAMP domain-containing sensor histidine kinase [Sphingobacterium sp. xlx-130]
MESETIINILLAGIVVSKTIIVILAYLLVKKNSVLKAEKIKLEKANAELVKQSLAIRKYVEELKAAENFKTKVLSIASHDLRAPFASIESLLKFEDLLLMGRRELEAFFETLRQEVGKSRVMLDEVLLWTESQLRDTIENKAVLNLNVEIGKLLNQFSYDIEKQGKKVFNNIDQNSNLNINKPIFTFVIRNVISNAIKYGRPEGVISVDYIKKESGECCVIISNESEELAEHTIKNLNYGKSWERRKMANSEGTGLGISLCKDLFKRIGGIIHFENKIGKGIAVTIIFPNDACEMASCC